MTTRMDDVAGHVVGENGHAELCKAQFGEPLVGLFFKLVRDESKGNLEALVADVVTEAKANADADAMRRLALLAFQTRWCRGGKGEKLLFYRLFDLMLKHMPEAALELVDLVPQYGYWKDLFLMLDFLKSKQSSCSKETYETISNVVWVLCAEQHKRDMEAMGAESTGKLSLYAKYVPSEKSSLDRRTGAVKAIATRVYGDVEQKKMLFRKDVAAMREKLDIAERLMCSNCFDEIRFSKVPSQCLSRNMRGFLDEDKEGNRRHPGSKAREVTRDRLMQQIVKGAVNGKQMQPHQLVAKLLHRNVSPAVEMATQAQWVSMRASVQNMIDERKEHIAALAETGQAPPSVDMGRVVPLSDVSGSMDGTPMLVSIALGILCSELTHPSFRNKVLTFESNPRWHTLKEGAPLPAKVQSLSKAPWGGSTNFYQALVKIGEVVARDKLKQEDIPTLLVISDMQFNTAGRGTSSTVHANITKYFAALGRKLHGKPLDPPLIVFWNVRSATTGFPAKADTPGVILMSGFSAALLKFLLSGELVEAVAQVDEETGEVKVERRAKTPEETLRAALEDEGLAAVGARLAGLPDRAFLSSRMDVT